MLKIENRLKRMEKHMIKIKQMFVGLIAVLMLVPAAAWAQVVSGQAAPNFTLTDSNGQKLSLSDCKGKYVVLEWFNPDCPFVKKHYNSGNIPNLQKEYTAKGVIWLSINSSAPGKQGSYTPQGFNKFMKDKGAAPTAVLLDTDGKAGHLYGAQTTPHMFVINPQGTLIYQGAIDDIPSVDIADVAKAKNYVKAALDEAMNGKPVTVATTKSYGCSVKY
jgi:peroxiredoxin